MSTSLPTGPGSPQDVPPAPGQFPIDPATLPGPIRDELQAPDPVAIDTASKELKDGLNHCPKCGSRLMEKTSKKNRATYIYYDANGKKVAELIPGENGVTEALITMLHEDDDETVDAERREQYRTPAHYQAY